MPAVAAVVHAKAAKVHPEKTANAEAASAEGEDAIAEALKHLNPEVAEPAAPATGFFKYQKEAERIYLLTSVQVSVAGLIALNFLVNISQAQFDPKGGNLDDFYAVWELFFNVAFLIELILNMYGTWCCRFWKSGWNCFDFAVVLIGWLFQLKVPLPGPMKLLRMMRAFRVFRLFKRIKSLNKIMVSLAQSIPGVMNAFLIQMIIVCIFAIIGVDRFRDYGEGGSYTNELGETVYFQTSRGQDYGFEYWGDFGKSLYTMFQVLTGESWAEAIARPLFNSNSATTSTGSAIFFVFFSILNGVVLINVVVAELLEKFASGSDPDPPEEGEEIPEDPIKVNLDRTAKEVVELQKQMSDMCQVVSSMQQRVADVAIVRAQVAALMRHRVPLTVAEA